MKQRGLISLFHIVIAERVEEMLGNAYIRVYAGVLEFNLKSFKTILRPFPYIFRPHYHFLAGDCICVLEPL